MKYTRILGLIALLVMISFLIAEVVQAAPVRTGFRLGRGPGQGLTPPGGYAGQKIGETPPLYATYRAPRSIIAVLHGGSSFTSSSAPMAPSSAGLNTVPLYDSDDDPNSPNFLLDL